MSFIRTSRVLAALAAAGGVASVPLACSSNSGGSPGGNGGDASTEAMASGDDGGSASVVDGGGTTSDAAGGDAGDAGVDTGTTTGGEDGGPEAGVDSGPQDGGSSDGGSDAMPCVGDWVDASWVYSVVTPDAGSVILHATGTGTQNYECEAVDSDAGTTYAWTFVGPQADLDDCDGTLIGHHFASEAGASAPEWQTLDGTYVIGSKKVSFTPDGGSGSIPWLLLEATSHGGTGTLESADWITRANTSGGNAPATGCSESTVGTSQDVDYTADYFFWGP